MKALVELKRDLESELKTQQALQQTVSTRWLVARLKEQLGALEDLVAVSAPQKTPAEKLAWALSLLEAVAPTLGPVREALLRSVGIESVRGTLQLLEAEARLDAKLDKANAGGDR